MTLVVDVMEPLAVGDETRILTGSMQGLPVRVVKVMPAEQRAAVLMEFLGQEVETIFLVRAGATAQGSFDAGIRITAYIL